MTRAAEPLFVLDAHALWWYWTDASRLGTGARTAFDEIEPRRATGLVPAIVVAEIHYLSRRIRRTRSVEQILASIDRASSLRLLLITRRQLLAFGELGEIPEMHDRLIAAAALTYGATLVSRDAVFQRASHITTIW